MSETTVTFHSPTDTLRLVRKAATRKMNDQGQWDTVPGEAVVFKAGRFVTSKSEEVAFLRSHKECGRLFHELGAERDRVVDNGSAVIGRVMELALESNADAIADILVAERNSYSRPEVLVACEKALERIGAEVPAPPAPPEHQLERVRAEPAAGPAVGAPVTDADPVAGSGVPGPPAQATSPVPSPGTF